MAVLGLLVLIWGTTWAAITISLRGIPPFLGVALRFGVAGLSLVVVAKALGLPLRSVNRRESRLRLAHLGLSFCISYGVVFWAQQWVPSGLASVLFASFPLMVAVMAHFWLPGERLTFASVTGTVVGFAGIVVIFAEDFRGLGGPEMALAVPLILVSPLASAAAIVAVKRGGKGVHPVPFNGMAMADSAVVRGVAAAIWERDRTVVFDVSSIAAILYLAIVGSAVTFTLYIWLLEHMQARHVALIGYATPVVALAVGAVFLREPLTLQTLVGSALVVAGVALASWAPSNSRQG